MNFWFRFYIFLALFLGIYGQRCKRWYIPKNLTFSAATAAFQIEGAAREDGKGPSMLDIFYHRVPGSVADNSSADISCDSYHKYKEDVQMLKYLGVQQYRMSIAWSRILPDGTLDKVNKKGIEYYNNVINELVENGIEPLVTITHGDEPQELVQLGGWLNQDMPKLYAKYARLLFKIYGDRVKKWATLNEILPVSRYCYCGVEGNGAPGSFKEMCPWTYYRAAHNMLLGHVMVYRVYEKEFKKKQKGMIGMAHSTTWYFPKTNQTEDVEAAKRAFNFTIGWLMEPLFHGDYPEVMKTMIEERSLKDGFYRSRLPAFTEKQKNLIKGTLDFIGLNYYSSASVKNRKTFPYGTDQAEYDGAFDGGNGPTDSNQGLRNLINYCYNRYKAPIIVTENGAADGSGNLNDTFRINYLREKIIAVLQSIQDGSKVLGYTVWSLMDNFEWGSGYTAKYGLYYVDFKDPNRKRVPKASVEWYKKVIDQRYIDEEC